MNAALSTAITASKIFRQPATVDVSLPPMFMSLLMIKAVVLTRKSTVLIPFLILVLSQVAHDESRQLLNKKLLCHFNY